MSLENIWLFLALMVTASLVVRVLPVVPARLRIPASFVVLLVFLCWAPFILDDFRTRQLATAGVWIVAAMGLNILTGYNGQISLGHGALVALGAYVAAILMDDTTQISFIDSTPWPFWLATLMAGIMTAFVGFFLGIPALRLSGPYLFKSITLLASVVIGGLASILGSVIGGTAFIFLPSDAPDLVAQIPGLDVDIVSRAPGAIQGAIVILVILLMPAGASGFVQRMQQLRLETVLSNLRSLPVQIAERLPRSGRGGRSND